MAFLDENGLTRLWNKIENVIGSAINQLRGNIENTINAIENTFTKPYSGGNIRLYVSKNGSDSNDGLSQETPLLTLDKAFEIANRKLPSNVNSCLELCVGPGDWGDFILMAKPYITKLFAYNYTTYVTDIANINQLPHFNNMSIRSSIQIYNANIDLCIVYDNSYAFFGNGLIVIGQAQAKYGGTLFIGSVAQMPLYIKNTNQSNVFYVEYNGVIAFPNGGRQVTIYENLNVTSGFFWVYRQGKIIGLAGTQFNILSGVTVTGVRASVSCGGTFSRIAGITFPGTTGPNYEDGAIIDGQTYHIICEEDRLNHYFVGGATKGGSAVSLNHTSFGTAFCAPTSEHRIALGTQPNNNDEVQLYSITNENISSATNTKHKTLWWNAGSGRLLADHFTVQTNEMGNSATPGIFVTGTASNFAMNIINTSITKGTAPSATQYYGIGCYGKDYDNYNKRIAMFEGGLTTANVSVAAIRAYNCTTNTNTGNCSIECHVDASGNSYTTAPTPAVADNSTKIATTAWVRTATGNLAANAANVTGTVAIANGGTGATTRLNALKALTNENVGTSATYFLTITNSWGKGGYSSTANAKTVLGISGSDRRIKDDIDTIPENILDAWENIDWKQFKMKKDVRLLGENAKLHFGAVVQDIQSVFSNSDIDSSKYGFLYQEDYPEEERDLPSDENSEVTNGDKWYLKYEEALCIEAAYQRRRADRLEKELNALKEQVKELFTRLG